MLTRAKTDDTESGNISKEKEELLKNVCATAVDGEQRQWLNGIKLKLIIFTVVQEDRTR